MQDFATWSGFVLRSLVTATGLKVTATHFEKTYETGLKVSKAEFRTIQLTRHDVCPQWNYTTPPRPKIAA